MDDIPTRARRLRAGHASRPHTGAGSAIRARLARLRAARLGADRGAATAEYAVVIMAAVGFAGLLVAILRSGEVQQILTDLVRTALGAAG